MTLLIFDDAENAYSFRFKHENKTAIVVPFEQRFPSLGAKYNALIDYAYDQLEAEQMLIWEDDDVYLPNHVERYMECFQKGAAWVKPTRIYTYFGRKLEKVNPYFSYFASIGFSKQVKNAAVRFIEDQVVQFDIDFMRKLEYRFGHPCDPVEHDKPTYVFRWDTTGTYHGQGFMHIGNDWYKAIPFVTTPETPIQLKPELDKDTEEILQKLNDSTS